MPPISYWHGCCFQLLFQTVLPTNKLQLVSLSVSCRLLSRNSVQTNKELSLEPVGFFRRICFLGAGKYLTFYKYRQWNSVKLCVFLVGCHPSDSDLAIQFVDWCKWLVYVASLLAHKPHLLLFFCIDWVGYCENLATVLFADLHWRTCFFLQEKPPTTTAPNPLWCCSNEGHGFFHSRKNYSKCLKNALAFSDQAHNLTSIFHTNAFSNMLLQGSSARVLQCSLLPSYTGAVFNSSGARLRELCQ